MFEIYNPNVYIIQLEQDRYFVYESNEKYSRKIMLECEIYHTYPKQYKPIKILEKYEFKKIESVDSLVKEYMILYGIEYVRGGSYSDPILTKEQEKIINIEFDYIDNGPKYDYSFTEVLNYEYRTYDSLKEIDEIASKIKTEYDKYIFEKERYEALFPKQYSTLIIKINNDDIDWLYECCILLEKEFREKKLVNNIINNSTKNIVGKYKQILGGLKHLFFLLKSTDFFENQQSKIEEYAIYLKYPEFIFDQFFLDKYPRISLDIVESFCSFLKLLVDTATNRIEEYKFDLSTYPRVIEWKTDRILYILEKKKRDFNDSVIDIIDVD
jgi:rRNA processing protein Gar1